MKIAIPLNNGILAEHFGHCPNFELFTVENNKVTHSELVASPPHQPGLLPPWLAERGVTDVIAGGMGQRAIDLFKKNNVNVFTGAPVVSSNDLINGFLTNSLTFTVNYCDH